MNRVIGLIGAGNMGGALLNGLSRGGMQNQVLVFDVSDRAVASAVDLGALAVGSAAELARQSDLIILAVKPQFYPEVLPQIRGCLLYTSRCV